MCNKDFNKERKLYISVSDNHCAIRRQVFNGKIAKVSIIKWSLNRFFVAGLLISDQPKMVENTKFPLIFQNLG